MAVFSLFMTTWLVICLVIISTDVSVVGSHPLTSLEDTMKCVRTCSFRERVGTLVQS